MSPASSSRRRRPRVPGDEVAPTPVGEALAAVGAELGLPPPGVLGPLSTRWPEIVGAQIAEHARLRSLRRGVLTIAVDAPAWATELRYLDHELRSRIAAIVGADAVEQVRIVVAPR